MPISASVSCFLLRRHWEHGGEAEDIAGERYRVETLFDGEIK
jgi:hypothetical protein